MLDAISEENILRVPEDFPVGHAFSAPPGLLRVQRELPLCPVRTPHGHRMWLVTRHADVRAVLTDPRLTRQLAFPGAPRLAGEDVTSLADSLFNLEGPRHTVLRKVLSASFNRGTVEWWAAQWRRAAAEAVKMLRLSMTSADLVTAFVDPVVADVAASLLGLSRDDFLRVRENVRWQTALTVGSGPVGRATANLVEFASSLLTQSDGREQHLPVTALSAAYHDKVITRREAVATTTLLLLTATDSLVTPLATGLLALLTHQDQLGRLLREETPWAHAVEEVLRFYNNGPTNYPRLARADVSLTEGTIRSGEAVITSTLAAGWDPRLFPVPDRFDIHRRNGASLVFGAGPHRCPAAAFSRSMLAHFSSAAFTGLPGLRLGAMPAPKDSGNFFTRPTVLLAEWS
ncbi:MULTISPECIES: cytochrome P450 [unclassified Streptomyces]|uniref:cytochrome P450 n=1 Tax=unclassified Streptomyces TaxID=2593676 RepID=UPI003820F0A1